MQKKFLCKRKFLNAKGFHSLAAIYANIYLEQNTGSEANIFAELSLSDCGRQVSIDIDTYDKPGLRNTISKLMIIRDTCDEMISAIEKAYEEKGKLNKDK